MSEEPGAAPWWRSLSLHKGWQRIPPSLRAAAGACSVTAAAADACRSPACCLMLLLLLMPLPPHCTLLVAAAEVTGLHTLNDRRRHSAIRPGTDAEGKRNVSSVDRNLSIPMHTRVWSSLQQVSFYAGKPLHCALIATGNDVRAPAFSETSCNNAPAVHGRACLNRGWPECSRPRDANDMPRAVSSDRLCRLIGDLTL